MYFSKIQSTDKVEEGIIDSLASFSSWKVWGTETQTTQTLTDQLIEKNLTSDLYDLKHLHFFVFVYFFKILFCFVWPHCMTCRISIPRRGTEPGQLQWKCQVLTTGPPENSQSSFEWRILHKLQMCLFQPFVHNMIMPGKDLTYFKKTAVSGRMLKGGRRSRIS